MIFDSELVQAAEAGLKNEYAHGKFSQQFALRKIIYDNVRFKFIAYSFVHDLVTLQEVLKRELENGTNVIQLSIINYLQNFISIMFSFLGQSIDANPFEK